MDEPLRCPKCGQNSDFVFHAPANKRIYRRGNKWFETAPKFSDYSEEDFYECGKCGAMSGPGGTYTHKDFLAR